MGSKPPQSKAKKSKNKTAKKLPGNIAKRWKEKRSEKLEDDKKWEEKDTADLVVSSQVAAVVELPVAKAAIALSSTNSGGKKKRNISNNNR